MISTPFSPQSTLSSPFPKTFPRFVKLQMAPRGLAFWVCCGILQVPAGRVLYQYPQSQLMTELNSGLWTESAALVCPNQLLTHIRSTQNLTWSIGLSIWPTMCRDTLRLPPSFCAPCSRRHRIDLSSYNSQPHSRPHLGLSQTNQRCSVVVETRLESPPQGTEYSSA